MNTLNPTTQATKSHKIGKHLAIVAVIFAIGIGVSIPMSADAYYVDSDYGGSSSGDSCMGQCGPGCAGWGTNYASPSCYAHDACCRNYGGCYGGWGDIVCAPLLPTSIVEWGVGTIVCLGWWC